MTNIPPNMPGQVQREPYERLPEAHANGPGEASITELFSEILVDAQTLIRKELSLARQEFADTLKTARQSAVLLGAGAGVLAVGGLMLVFALAHGIAAGFDLPLWLAYLIVGAIMAIIGGAVVASGVNQLKQVNVVPNETIDSLRKDL